MGQRIAFSDVDLRKINKLYQCGTRSISIETASKPVPTATRLISINNNIAQVIMTRAAFLKKIRRQISNNNQRRIPLSLSMTNFGSTVLVRRRPWV